MGSYTTKARFVRSPPIFTTETCSHCVTTHVLQKCVFTV